MKWSTDWPDRDEWYLIEDYNGRIMSARYMGYDESWGASRHEFYNPETTRTVSASRWLALRNIQIEENE